MKTKKKFILLGCLCMLLLMVSCGKKEITEKADTENKKTEVYISAAASLTDVINELNDQYEKDHPDVRILTNYGGSGALQAQIEEGAPADIFISAADKQMNAIEEKDLIDKDSRVELLKNEVVLITQKDSKTDIDSFANVQDKVKNIAIADPASVPVGQYSEQIFTYYGNWDAIKNIMVQSQDVRQSLDWVVTGNAECATVYKTDAYVEKDKVKIVAVAPDESHKPINYPIAVIKKSKDKKEVIEYYDFLKSEGAKKVYEKYGFVVNK